MWEHIKDSRALVRPDYMVLLQIELRRKLLIIKPAKAHHHVSSQDNPNRLQYKSNSALGVHQMHGKRRLLRVTSVIHVTVNVLNDPNHKDYLHYHHEYVDQYGLSNTYDPPEPVRVPYKVQND